MGKVGLARCSQARCRCNLIAPQLRSPQGCPVTMGQRGNLLAWKMGHLLFPGPSFSLTALPPGCFGCSAFSQSHFSDATLPGSPTRFQTFLPEISSAPRGCPGGQLSPTLPDSPGTAQEQRQLSLGTAPWTADLSGGQTLVHVRASWESRDALSPRPGQWLMHRLPAYTTGLKRRALCKEEYMFLLSLPLLYFFLFNQKSSLRSLD